MSSTMLAILLKVARKIAGAQGQLRLCALTPDLLEIFRITRFDRLFEIHAEEWAALDAFH
jgi:anti-sigma B factor antagonist